MGEEPNLLAYRALVLQCTGARVKITSGKAASRIIKREEFSLIVVGHTIHDESARTVYEAAKTRTPSPIVLRLWSWTRGPETDAEKYSDAASSTDPAELVHLITELLKM